MNPNPASGRAGKVAGLVVAGLFAVVGVGAAVAMVVTSDGATSGKSSVQELAEATVAAWAAGDGDRAVGLMPSYGELAAALDCPSVDPDTARANHQRHRAEVWAKARVWQPRRPHLRQLTPGEVIATPVGEALGKCQTAAPFALQLLEVSVELDGRGHGQYDVTLSAVRLGTRWYLMDAGTLPAGLDDSYEELLAERRARQARRDRKSRRDYGDDDDDAYDDDRDDTSSLWAAVGGPSTGPLRALREFRDRTCACKDLGCIEQVQAELAAFSIKHEDSHPAITDQDAAIKLGVEMTQCTDKVRAADRRHTGVPACDEYVAIIEWYMKCDTIPPAARDGMKQGIDAMKQGWAAASNLSDDARQAMADSCRAAVDAMRQAGDAMGCGPLPP